MNKGCSRQAAGPGCLLWSSFTPFLPHTRSSLSVTQIDPDAPWPECTASARMRAGRCLCAPLGLWAGLLGLGSMRKELPAGGEVEAQITSPFREVRFPDFSHLVLGCGQEALCVPTVGRLISDGALRNHVEAYSAGLPTPGPWQSLGAGGIHPFCEVVPWMLGGCPCIPFTLAGFSEGISSLAPK